jgi:lipopolysaccharide export system permease protein
MKNFTPYKLINYLSKEFLISLFIVFVVFLSLSILINFVEEMTFFKDKKIENIIWIVSYLTACKTLNTLIELSIFIFLFSGVVFFVKIKKNNEMNTILLSGLSKLLPILSPAIISFFIGLFIIFFLSPISSSTLKFYEITKRLYSANDNLISINGTGLWFMETLPGGFNIIRADKIVDNNFSKLNNVTIYMLDNEFNFLKRLDSKVVYVKNKQWLLEKVKILDKDESIITNKNINSEIQFISSFNIDDLKNYFSNAATVSFWEITNNVKTLNLRGYSADELKIKLHKYLSLPIYLFGMILLSTIFTIGIKKEYNTLMYLFFGLIAGFILYFLNDLSIAIGLSNKLPLVISIWTPVLIIIFLSITNLITLNER